MKTWQEKDGLPFKVVTASTSTRRPATSGWACSAAAWRGSRGGRFDHWHQLNSGLVNDVVYGVAVENDNVWAATTAGASRLNTVTGEWTIFTEKNAPMEEIWNYAVDYDGKDKVYLAVWGSGVLEYDIATGRWKDYLDPDGEMEIDLYRDDGIIHVIVTGREPGRGRRVGLDLLRRLPLRRPPLARLRAAGGRPALATSTTTSRAAARRRRWFCSDKGLGVVTDAPTEDGPGSPTRATPRRGRGKAKVTVGGKVARERRHAGRRAAQLHDRGRRRRQRHLGRHRKGLGWGIGEGYYPGTKERRSTPTAAGAEAEAGAPCSRGASRGRVEGREVAMRCIGLVRRRRPCSSSALARSRPTRPQGARRAAARLHPVRRPAGSSSC